MNPIIITLALLAGFAFRKAGYPPLLGYLLVGFITSELSIGSADELAPLADAGILMLLFTIGLKLQPQSLMPAYVWGSAILHIVIVVPMTAALIMIIGNLFEPLAFGSYRTPWMLAFALSFSSTVLAVKMFEERGDANALYARIAIGVLVIQDVLAVVWLVFSTGHWPSPWALLLLGLPLLRGPLGRLFRTIGHGELLLLSGIVLTFASAALFEAVHLKEGLGALVAGALLAAADRTKARELYRQLLGLKNLLLVAFFLQIGYYGWPSMHMLMVAAIFAVVIVLRPLVYFVLLTSFGLRARTAWYTGISLFSYSEFGLIVGTVAVSNGQLQSDWVTTLALVLAVSFFLATPVNNLIHELYRRFEGPLERYQKADRLPMEQIGSVGDAQIAILGMGRIGREAYATLDLELDRIIGVEENFERWQMLQEMKINSIHGDATDRLFWEQVGLLRMDLILVGLSNYRENLEIVSLARELGYQGKLAVVARFPDERAELESLGCIAFYLYEDLGHDFAHYVLSQVESVEYGKAVGTKTG